MTLEKSSNPSASTAKEVGDTPSHPPLRLLEDYLLVELTEPNRVLPSGIVLPETVGESYSEAKVHGVGPGLRTDNPERSVRVWIQKADKVYFPKHALETLAAVPGFSAKWGIIRERDVVCVENWAGDIIPHNDWLLLTRCGSEAKIGSIFLPQVARRAPRCGYLEEWGNGTPITEGELAGCRRPVRWDLGVEGKNWLVGLGSGTKVYWEAETKRFQIANMDGTDPYVFIRARDAIAFEPVVDADEE